MADRVVMIQGYGPVPLALDDVPVRDPGGNPLYRQSWSLPLDPTSAEYQALSDIRNRTGDLLASRASLALQRRIQDIVIRDILPHDDLGLTNNKWISGALVNNAFAPYIAQQLPITQLMAFYAVEVLTPTPLATVVQFANPSSVLVDAEIEDEFGFPNKLLSIIRPTVIYNPNDTVIINIYNSGGTTPQAVVPWGYVAETVGLKVSPPNYEYQTVNVTSDALAAMYH